MGKYDVRESLRAIDELLGQTSNPHHRAILLNYRTHSLLEQMGRAEEIFTGGLMVPEPVYRLNTYAGDGSLVVFDGLEAVKSFYAALLGIDFVVVLEDEKLAVADWGFSSYAWHNMFVAGSVLAQQGHEVEDPDAMYIDRSRVAMFWHYSADAKLIGEDVYKLTPSEFFVVDPKDIVTPAEAKEALRPHLDDPVMREMTFA